MPSTVPSLKHVKSQAVADIGRRIEEAYQQGRADMRHELLELLGNEQLVTVPQPLDEIVPTARTAPKASPGTVKPTVLNLIETSNGGMRTDTIITTTGFKENSVRAAVSALMAEGKIRRAANGFWVKSADAVSTDEHS